MPKTQDIKKGSIIAQSLRFKRAVYLGDMVIVTVIVKKLIYQKEECFFDTICKVKNKIVIDGEADLFVP
ncbi:MAG: hypothetical protein U9O24_02120 [Campylobacterota bacterium]|nr:hypothetical protein [Campylobacterota bacterium]